MLWLAACLWLFLQAWLTLDATFQVPVLHHLVAALHLPPRLLALLEWLKVTTWPVVSLIAALVIRQEAQRWLKGNGGSRKADRLMTAWFVFTGTLFTIDHLTPAITVVWPVGAVQATVWLLLARGVSLISRILHATSRRRLHRYLRRWPLIQWFSRLAELLILRPRKGVSLHEPSPHATLKRRAR